MSRALEMDSVAASATPTPVLPFAYGGPAGKGLIRQCPEDFRVEEIPVCEPDGAGEHLWLWVRKRQANTEWVARQLARVAEVPARDVSYAGLKDRHAVTEQWFSVQLPGRPDPDWAAQPIEGVTVLRAVRHSRKLKRGALRGNRFDIRVTELRGDREIVDNRLQDLSTSGLPNYFGAQRFGNAGDNLVKARSLLTAPGVRRLPRHQRSLYLSALRSQLFNQVLAARIINGEWNQPLPGDVLQLDGARACFRDDSDPTLPQRIQALEVHPTGPLWGRGELPTAAAARRYEQGVADDHPQDCRLLESAGLEQDRRALRVRVEALQWHWQDDTLVLSFTLPAGSYATVLLRECLETSAATDREESG